jgi:hypothetical protein
MAGKMPERLTGPNARRIVGPGDLARLNALLAVELDPVRRHEHVADLRLTAAVLLAPRVAVAEALLEGVAIPGCCIDVAWRTTLGLGNQVVLDEPLALAVVAAAPLKGHRG